MRDLTGAIPMAFLPDYDMALASLMVSGSDEHGTPITVTAEKRGILLEAMSATLMLLAGADILVIRHPESARLVREMITELSGRAD